MTGDAQSALRRIMEDTSSSTRFCKIIEPILSRCVPYRFQPISKQAQLEKLRYICENEQVEYELRALENLIDISEGDLRKSINTLQSASTLFDKNIGVSEIYQISGIVPDTFIEAIIQKMKDNNLTALIESIDQIMNQFQEFLIIQTGLDDIKKSRMVEKVALCDQQMTEGSKDDLALYALFSACQTILHGTH